MNEIIGYICAIVSVGAICLIVGRYSGPERVITVEKEGRVIERTVMKTITVTNVPKGCEEIAADRDMWYQEYLAWYFAQPYDSEATDTEIRFSMRSNRYALRYSMRAVARWRFTPMVGWSIGWGSALSCSPIAGVAVDYADIGGQVIAGTNIAAVTAYIRF